MGKKIKTAYCIKCKRETPILINRTQKKKDEILQIGMCAFCFDEVILVESADVKEP